MQLRQSKQHLLIALMFGFLAGILYANIVADSFSTVTGVFHESFIQQYVSAEVNVEEYIPYLFKCRVIPVICLIFAGCTRFKKPAAFGILIWTGFLAGVVSVASVLCLGARGMLLCVAGMFPQFVFYVLTYAVIIWHLYRYPHSEWTAGQTVFTVVTLIAGILTEACLNPVIVKWMLKIIS